MKKDKLYGGYEIAKYLGYQGEYVKVTNLLNFLEVPMEQKRYLQVYSLTKEQAKILGAWIEKGKKLFI